MDMKRFFLYAIAIAALALAGCGGNGGGGTMPENGNAVTVVTPMDARWNLERVTILTG